MSSGMERDIAIMEGEMNHSEDEYFKARPQVDTGHCRHLFRAGFERAWQAARAQGVTVPMKRIAEKKLDQMGATVHGVLVRNEAGALACVSEHGRVTWLDDSVMGPAGAQPEQPGVGVVPDGHTETSLRRAELFLDSLHLDACNEVKTLRKLLTDAPTAPAVQGGGVDDEEYPDFCVVSYGHSGYELRDEVFRSVDDAAIRANELERKGFSIVKRQSTYTHPHNGEQASSDWVRCPVCGEPDMQQTKDRDGNALIHCVNHGCLSNGGPAHNGEQVYGFKEVGETSLYCREGRNEIEGDVDQDLAPGTKLYVRLDHFNGEQGGEWNGDPLLPPVGAVVLSDTTGHRDVEFRVTGYHVLEDLKGSEYVHRVFVDLVYLDDPTATNSRMLRDIRPQPPKSKEDRGHE